MSGAEEFDDDAISRHSIRSSQLSRVVDSSASVSLTELLEVQTVWLELVWWLFRWYVGSLEVAGYTEAS